MENKKVVVKWMDAKIYPRMHKRDNALERKMDIFESVGFLVGKNEAL